MAGEETGEPYNSAEEITRRGTQRHEGEVRAAGDRRAGGGQPEGCDGTDVHQVWEGHTLPAGP